MNPSPSPDTPESVAPKGATARLFLALWPSPEARTAASRWQAAQAWPADAQTVVPSNVHVTLPFIGAVALSRVQVLAAACTVTFRAFDLVLDRLEVWHHGTVVLLPSTLPDALVDLHERLTTTVRAQGIELDTREFRPHLTLARHCAGLVPADPDLAPVQWRVNRYVLAVSAGGQYNVVQSYPAS
ncbi:MAG: RNA 2',3'-cyclic phosphodiesterase [Burkholderiales bacterium]|nr:RNA 2',3'-cyclic phosphodiesterase [Burkholderiales bacterium]